MKALVTGATGFIGGALARRLVAEKWRVRALVRDPTKAAALALEGEGIELAVGDLTQPTTLPPALEGIDVLFHAAANVDIVFPKREEILRTNVEGTRALLEAALAARVHRVVYFSSVAAIGRRMEDADETTWHDGNYVSVYEESKHKAEEVALGFARRGLDIVHILPSVVLGPGDPKSGAFILRYLRREIPAVPRPDGSANLVHVDDLVDGVLLAYRKGRAGERYIFNQATWPTGQVMAELERLTNVPAPRRVPRWLAMSAATVEEARARLLGRRARVSRQAVRLATRRYGYSSEKARRELGWNPRPFEERFASVVAHWQREVARNGHEA